MGLLRKLAALLAGYLVLYGEVTVEIGRIAADFFSARWRRFRALPSSEQLFAFLSLFVVIFTFLPWRSYQIRFGSESPRRHGIYTDDMAIVLLGCILALIPLIGHLVPNEPKRLSFPRLYRLSGVLLVFALAILNWIFPQRIAATHEAQFTWSFYGFQLLALFWLTVGVLGARFYAQYPAKN